MKNTSKVIAQQTKGWQMEMNKLTPTARNNRKRVMNKRIRRKHNEDINEKISTYRNDNLEETN